MVTIEIVTGLGGPEVRAAWQALADADPDATIFQTPRYLQVLHRELGEGTARIAVVRRDGELIGIVPELVTREGSPTGPIEVLRFQGGNEVTDYQGPVARPADRAEVVSAWIGALSEDRGWDEAMLAGVRRPAGWIDLVADAVDEHGLQLFARDTHDVCPRVDLRGGYDAWLDRLPGKDRQELKRKARKLARDAGAVELVEVPSDQLDAGLETFLGMAEQAEGDKGSFFVRDRMRAWFGALADEFAAEGVFRLHLLEVGGLAAAATVSLVHGREWGLYNSAFDEALGTLAPGMVQVGELIRLAAGEGLEVFDLLRGDEAYKYRFGATDLELDRATLIRSST